MAADKSDKRPVLPTRGLMRRVKALVDGYGGGPPRGGVRSPYGGWNPGIQRAKVTTAIPTGTFASPSSSGQAQIYYFNGSSWDAGPTVAVFNDHTLPSSIAVDKAVKLAWIAGMYFLVAADCDVE